MAAQTQPVNPDDDATGAAAADEVLVCTGPVEPAADPPAPAEDAAAEDAAEDADTDGAADADDGVATADDGATGDVSTELAATAPSASWNAIEPSTG